MKQAMERQVDLMGRVNDLYTRYEAQQRITMDLMNARAAMHLAPGLAGATGAGDISGARLLRSAENSVPKTQ